MSTPEGISRRTLFKLAGGGIVIFIGLEPLIVRAQDARRLYPEDFNAYLIVGDNGRVTVFSGKIEIVQGVLTSQAQMVAEELDVELAAIDMVLGDTDKCPWDMGTFGSMTTRMFGPALRAAAAEAKVVLLELAADSLKVPQAQLVAKDGVIFDQQNQKNRITYGQLAKGQKIERHLQAKPALKDPAQFKI